MTHTPEPWDVFTTVKDQRQAIRGPIQGLAGRWWIAKAVSAEPQDAANFDRMRVCVNACASLPDPEVAIPALIQALEKFVDSMKSNQREKCDVALSMARSALARVQP